MNRLFLSALCGLLTCCGYGQFDDALNPNSAAARVLFLDYQSLNDAVDTDLSNGLEVAYVRHLTNFLNVAIPLRAGVINVPGQMNKRTIIGADALLQLQYYRPEARLVPYAFGGVGRAAETDDFNYTSFPVGLGVNLKVGRNSFVNLQGEYRNTTQPQRNAIHLGVGYFFNFNALRREEPVALVPVDIDADGIVDSLDLCPNEAGPAELNGCPDADADGVADINDECMTVAGLPALNGCPDGDGDGVADPEDRCPTEAGPVALGGCPDRDGDGIVDAEDRCPDEAGIAKKNGCPEPVVTDQDGDGFEDAADRCPTEAGTIGGCPDTDDDGVADNDDKCPNAAGPRANQGCPEVTAEVRRTLSTATQNVEFETGKDVLKASSFRILNQVADILDAYPEYSLRIVGHTDNVGTEANNQRLSEARARSTYEYLLARDIAPVRIQFSGRGELQPIDSNDTPEGRERNRRVEFQLYVPR